MDTNDKFRKNQDTVPNSNPGTPYDFSYTANGYTIAIPAGGMAARGALSCRPGGVYVKQKLGYFHNPAIKLMLVEEAASTSDAPAGHNPNLIDGNWSSSNDPITTRHGGRGNANFGDGHAEPIDNQFSLDTNHVDCLN
jgi:prepilin-type processing-associated H-X9-DG protein